MTDFTMRFVTSYSPLQFVGPVYSFISIGLKGALEGDGMCLFALSFTPTQYNSIPVWVELDLLRGQQAFRQRSLRILP